MGNAKTYVLLRYGSWFRALLSSSATRKSMVGAGCALLCCLVPPETYISSYLSAQLHSLFIMSLCTGVWMSLLLQWRPSPPTCHSLLWFSHNHLSTVRRTWCLMGSSSHQLALLFLNSTSLMILASCSNPQALSLGSLDSALITMKKKQQQNFVHLFSSICTGSVELLSAWDLVHLVDS